LGFGGGVYTLNNGAEINGNGNLSVSGGTLDVKLAGGTAIANTVLFTLEDGIFQVDGSWNLPTTNNWNGGTLKSSGIITNSGTLTLGGNYSSKYLNTQLNNTGTIVENDYLLFFNDGAILNNSGNYELQSGDIRNSTSSIGTFNNSGTFKKTTTGTGTIRIAFNNTATLEAQSGNLNFANTYIHNNANLILKGGTVTFSNTLNINGGSIEGNGGINVGVTNSGLLNPRYASNTEFGRLTINSNYTETNSASINIQLGGSTAGTNFDQVDINGTATFDGTLNVSLVNNFTPTLDSTFDVLTYDSLNSSSNLDFTGLIINSALKFVPQWFNNKLTLKVVENSSTNLAIAPTNATQPEGNSGNKAFTFTVTRSGTTIGTNAANWAVTGTGIDAADFGGTLPSGIVTFAANEISKVITVNVSGDTTVEPDESFTVTLSNPTNGVTLGTATAIGTIINDDFSSITLIEIAGNTKFLKDGTNKYFAQVGNNTPVAIKNGTIHIHEGIYAGWQTLAAETVNGVNQVLWTNAGSNTMHVWQMNSSWERVSTQSITLNSAAAFAQETVFGVDANGDGTIGNPYTTVESVGNTKIVKDLSNKYFAQVGSNTPVAIKNGTTQIYEGIYAGWQTLAAETVNGVNQVLWKNAGSNTMHVWQMNSSWERVSTQSITLNSAAALAQETVFGVDANGDGIIGTRIALESVGNTSLIKNGENKLFTQVGNNTPIAIKNGTTHINEGIYAGWQTLAAETVNGVNQVLWKNAGSNTMHVWQMNSSWERVSTQSITLSSAAALAQETVFGVDANGDGTIGNPSSLNLIGTSGNDTLVGGANNDVLTGLGGKDRLTGGLGSDRFVYQTLTDSLLANFDEITDFNATTDRFLVGTTRSGFNNVGTVTSLDNTGISATLTAATFGANSAASFTFGTRTFVAINDATAGFSQTTDAIIEVTGLTGTLGLTNFVTV
jgi:hypothetical protein